MLESPIRITFVRHGESTANRAGRWQGQGDSPLSELGRQQAQAVGARLARRKFHRVIASDLQRAADTCRATGFDFETSQEFREFDVGKWEGLTREEVLERYPEDMERLRSGEDIPLGGGESHASFAARIDGALDRLLAQLEPGQHALVVCHGGVIGTVLARAMGLRSGVRWPLWRSSNTSLTDIVYGPEGASLHVFNDTLHLANVGPWPSYGDVSTCFALLSDAEPCAVHGAFDARYDGQGSFPALASLPTAEVLASVLSELGTRHPSHRVAISLRPTLIRAWVEDTFWLGGTPAGRVAEPPRGALSHVAYVDGKPQLLDFGVAASE